MFLPGMDESHHNKQHEGGADNQEVFVNRIIVFLDFRKGRHWLGDIEDRGDDGRVNKNRPYPILLDFQRKTCENQKEKDEQPDAKDCKTNGRKIVPTKGN